MKKLTFILIFFAFTALSYGQKSITHFCDYKGGDTHMKGGGRGDTNQIFYKEQLVGYIFCEKIKQPGGFMFQNAIYDLKMNKIAIAGYETGQFYIKYQNPYKMVYLKGSKFNNVIKQMVEIDKRLVP